MKLAKEITKRIVAVFLSLVLCGTCLMSAFAAEFTTHTTIADTGFTDEFITSSGNLFYNATYEGGSAPEELTGGSFGFRYGSIDTEGNETSSIPTSYFDSNAPALTNGTYSSDHINTRLNGETLWQGTAETGFTPVTNAYYELNIKLNSVYKNVEFLLIDAYSTKYRVTEYSIYASANADDLFTKPVVTRAKDTGLFRKVSFGDEEIQYISIRIYGLCTQKGIEALGKISSAYLRLSEIVVKGTNLGVTANAKVDAPGGVTPATAASVNKNILSAGETAVFTTINNNPELVFDGWKDNDGNVVSKNPEYSVEITESMVAVDLVASYKYREGLLISESFEGNTKINSYSDSSTQTFTKGTASDFSITPREGAEESTIVKFDKNDTAWSYAALKNGAKDVLKNFTLDKNSAYKFSYWYYIESVDDETKPLFFTAPSITYMSDPTNSGSSYTKFDGEHAVYGTTKGKWIKSVQYFYTYDTTELLHLFLHTTGDACTTGVAYIDEIKLEKAAAVEIDRNKADTKLDITLHKNYVGAYYKQKVGVKEIAETGSYTIYPDTGKVITSATMDGKALIPNSDGSYTFTLTTESALKFETATAEGWAGVTVEQKSGSGIFSQTTNNDANFAAVNGEDYSFKFVTGADANPVVTVNGELVEAADGVYTVKNVTADTLAVKVVCRGDEHRGSDGIHDAKGNDLSKYVKEVYDIPMWEGDTLFHETVTIFEGRKTARLLYPIDEIISVRSFDLKTEYTWGVDYDINEKGELVILEGSRFPKYTGEVDLTKPKSVSPIGYLYNFGIDVTFKHTKTWEDGYQATPVESKLAELPGLYEKLRNKQDVEIVFYGASSTVGASSSGADEIVDWTAADGVNSKWDFSVMIAPFVPTWARQTVAKLRSDWGYESGENSGIKFVNRSCHGRKAEEAANEVTIQAQLGVTNPDVVVLGFSGNDGRDPDFIGYIEQIILWTRENLNPDCEFIIASSAMNGSNAGKELALMRDAEFKALAEKYAGKGVIYAPTLKTSNDMFGTLLGCDYLENNLTHNNDFGARAFTSVMAGLLSDPGEVCQHTELETLPGLEATCIAAGLTEGKRCANCKLIVQKQDVTPITTTHKTKIVGYIPATLTESGYTGDQVCEDCEKIIKKGEIIKAEISSPFYNSVSLVAEGDCKTQNLKVMFEVPDGQSDIQAIQLRIKLPKGFTIKDITSPLSESGWLVSYNDTTGILVAVTNDNIDSLEKIATLTNGKYHIFTLALTLNDVEKIGNATATITVEDVTTAAGYYEEEYPITVSFGYNFDHNLVKLPAKAPTCTTVGLTEGKKCSLCDTVTIAQTEIKANGHKYNNGTVTKKPTCTADGVKTFTCSCGKTKTEAITKNGHNYENQVTKATTSKNGKTYKQCKVCKATASIVTVYAAKTIKLTKTKFTYTGKTIKPTVVVKDSKGKTISSKYYTVSGTQSTKKIGQFKITVKFKGNYSGSKTLTYTVNPKAVAGLKLKAGKKQMTVSFKKDSSVGGYEIVYATSKNFKSGKKTVKVTSTKKTFKKLASKKTYYVKVRAYKKVSGKTYYGAYTSVKSVKVK